MKPHDVNPIPIPRGEGTAPARVRIAMADDDRDMVDCLAELLQIWGHEVLVAVDGASALEAFPQFRPHLVLLDLGLPAMDGCELAAELRRLPWFEGVCIAALTGYDHQEAVARARSSGIDEYLVKPVQPSALRAIVARVAERGPLGGEQRAS